MGDTRYRGKIIWFLMTCRPDLLPVDIKRQGRVEIHIPLFYPMEDDEKKLYFVTMAAKQKWAVDARRRGPQVGRGQEALGRGHRGDHRGGQEAEPAGRRRPAQEEVPGGGGAPISSLRPRLWRCSSRSWPR